MPTNSNDLINNLTLDDLDGDIAVIAKHIGLAAVIFLIGGFGGQNFYVPSLNILERQMLKRIVESEYDGGNALELAQRYGTTPRYIKQLYGEIRKQKRASRKSK